MTEPPFPAYRGDEPYLFVCYAHADSEQVYREIARLHQHGFRLWYDEGISPGTIWRDELAQAIESARAVVFFVSPRSVASANCLRELDFALDRSCPIFAANVEQTRLPSRLRFRIGNVQSINLYGQRAAAGRHRLAYVLDALTGGDGESPSRPKGNVPATGPGHDPDSNADSGFVDIEVRPEDADHAASRNMATAVRRYLSWAGGAFRAFRPGTRPNAYVLEVAQHADAAEVVVSWQVEHASTEAVVWASRCAEARDVFERKRDRVADLVAESVISQVTGHVLKATRERPLEVRAYWHLLLEATQVYGIKADQIRHRFACVDQAIVLAPERGHARAVKADILSWLIMNDLSRDVDSDRHDARGEAQAALTAEPDDAFVLLHAGTVYSRLGLHDEGTALCRRAAALAPSVSSRNKLAMSLSFAGQPDEAIELYNDILGALPAGHTFPYGRLAVALCQACRFEQALEPARATTVHFPNDYYGWIVLANVYGHLERHEAAQAALETARELVPGLDASRLCSATERAYGRTPEQAFGVAGGLRSVL